MSKVDELVQELRSDGVERVALGEVARTVSGLKGKTKADFEGGNARYATYSNIFNNPILDVSDPSFVRIGDSERQNELKIGDVLVTGSSEVPDEVGMTSAVVSLPDEPLYFNSFCFALRFDNPKIILPNFSAHLFRSHKIREQVIRTANGVTRYNVSKPRFMKVQIPLPPLEVQEEIVRILDHFVELNRELEQEIAGREKQFAIALESMTDLRGAPVRRIADVCSRVCSGGTPSSKVEKYYGGDIPWVRTQDVQMKVIHEASATITEEGLEASSAKWIKENSVIVAMYGATAAKVALTTIPVTTNQACCNLEIDPDVADFRFVYYWLMRSYENLKALGEGSQSNINSAKVKSFPIPLPPLEVQEEIAAKLDTFTEYIDNLKRERELRQKQYEYYRDQLLDFEVKE